MKNLLKIDVLKSLFFAICFLLPVNLGKHFVFSWSYVNGLLVDYYVPTLFVQDLVIILLIVWWVLKGTPHIRKIRFEFLFVVMVSLLILFLGVVFGQNPAAGLYMFLRVTLYVAFAGYVYTNFEYKKDISTLILVLSVSSVFTSLLGVAQWLRQGAVFNNYLIFGEQPYSFSTPGTVWDNLFGYTKIPAQSLFRHPNAFAAYLVLIILIQIQAFIGAAKRKRLYFLLILFNVAALLATLSYFSFFVLAVGFVLILCNRYFPKLSLLVIFIVFLQVISLHLIPYFHVDTKNRLFDISIRRRVYMLATSYQLTADNPVLGVGLGNNLRYMDSYSKSIGDFRFKQPVHSVYVLLVSEGGLVVGSLFIGLMMYLLFRYRRFAVVAAIVLFAGFDHYFVTTHQLLLVFILTVSILITYNFSDEV